MLFKKRIKYSSLGLILTISATTFVPTMSSAQVNYNNENISIVKKSNNFNAHSNSDLHDYGKANSDKGHYYFKFLGITAYTDEIFLNEFEQSVAELINIERTKQGLVALQIDTALSKVSRLKSEDMQKNNYFSHISPTYGSPFDMIKKFDISYQSAGENIAQGQQTPEEVIQSWMNSTGHRENILNSHFTHMGVGYVESGKYWTQQFIQK
ncbi:CAP domain-containing protein [Bacillus mycoides]|nr:CAP domain-containing protein [Bacillus mycoides]